MPEISSITLPSGTTYTLKDATARAAAVGGLVLLGITTTPLTDGSTTNPIKIDNVDTTAINGSIAIYSNKEFVYVDPTGTSGVWHEFGDTSNLGDLAFKDSASGSFTPAGTVSKPTTTVELSSTTKYVASSATGGGSVTNGSAAACTLPVLTTSVANEVLTLGWAPGSFTPNTPTAVTLPSFSSQTIATGVSSADTSQPTFNGTAGTVNVS